MPAKTILNITPIVDTKSAIIHGEISIGELVKVVVNDVEDATQLRIRIRFSQKDIAKFPLDENVDFWQSEGLNSFSCILNMNTVEGRKFFEGKQDISSLPCVCILDVPVNESLTLSIAERISIFNWALADEDAPELVVVGQFVEAFANHRHTGFDGSQQVAHGHLLNSGTIPHDEIDTAINELTGNSQWAREKILTLFKIVGKIGDKLNNHILNKENPHGVTHVQAGALSQVEANALYLRRDVVPIKRRFRKYENPNEIVEMAIFDQTPVVADSEIVEAQE